MDSGSGATQSDCWAGIRDCCDNSDIDEGCVAAFSPASINSPLILFFICTICRTSGCGYRSVRRRSRISVGA